MSEQFKVKFRVHKILYPRNGDIQLGDFSIVSCLPIGFYPELKYNSYGNFVVQCNNSPVFNVIDIYDAVIEEFNHPKYGTSYKIVTMDLDNFELTEDGKRLFLKQILSPTQYESLVSHFDDPFAVIANEDIDELCSCKGIGRRTAERLVTKYHNNYKYAKIMAELADFDLSVKMIDRLLLTYLDSDTVIARVKENPYILANEVNGIGFKKADAIALKGGLPLNSAHRLRAYMIFFLESQAQEGNSWVAPTIFAGSIEDNLHAYFTDEAIRQMMYELYNEVIICWDITKTKIALTKYYKLELYIARELQRINGGVSDLDRDKDREKEIVTMSEQELGFEFTDEQLQSVDNILDHQISLLIAKSGSGKTTLIKLITNILQYYHKSVRIATLSGKASARIEEATGYQGSTIHRLLKYNPETEAFDYNKDNPLPYDVIIIDECSFLGGELFYSLVQAIKKGSKLLLVGDDKQIPAIGVSNIFFDIINSKKFNLNVLTKIHRQAQKSGIITEADKIRNGRQITRTGWTGKEVRGELQDFILDVYNDRCIGNLKIMEYYRQFCHSLEDTVNTIVVLPMKNRGEVNTFETNIAIQEEYNPHRDDKAEITVKKGGKPITYRVGDRVLNCVNNYKAVVYTPSTNNFLEWDEDATPRETELFNGFCGTILAVQDRKLIIKFDLIDEPIVVSGQDIQNLDLGYAITVHKMQGSEVPNVIMLIDYSSYIMNCRELIYTGVTRAKKKCVLLAEANALIGAIKTTQTINKQTFLLDILTDNLDMDLIS